jgi:hypothetical protein
MCSFIIVVIQPYVQIGLLLIQSAIEFLVEHDLVELLQDRVVKRSLIPLFRGKCSFVFA